MQSTYQISVVAGGWSFSKVPHSRVPGYLIAVNDSAYYMRRRIGVDEIVSMDRLWSEHRWAWMQMKQTAAYLRRSALKSLPHALQNGEWLHTFECDHETSIFSIDPARLNGQNSGICALNRAWLLKPKVLFLFGFDMQNGPAGERHWHPPYPWTAEWSTGEKKFIDWTREFDLIAQQFKNIGTRVWNVSERTRIRSFPILRPKDIPREAS